MENLKKFRESLITENSIYEVMLEKSGLAVTIIGVTCGKICDNERMIEKIDKFIKELNN